MSSKFCKTCEQELTPQNTSENQLKRFDYECRLCKKLRGKRNREARGEEWLDYRRAYAKKNSDKSRCWNLRKSYGLALEDWGKIFVEQGECCKICKTKEKPSMGWHTDHCHTTGKFRGILCHSCNTGLGKFKDSSELLREAAKYLEDLI